MLFLLCFSRPLGDFGLSVVSQGDLSVSAARFAVESSYVDRFVSVKPFADPVGCLFLLTMMS